MACCERLGIDSGPLAVIGSPNLDFVGFMTVGMFVLISLAALAIWRFGKIEERWRGQSANRYCRPRVEPELSATKCEWASHPALTKRAGIC